MFIHKLIKHAQLFCIGMNCSSRNYWQRGFSVTHVYGLTMSSLTVTPSQVDINLVINLYELTALFCNCYVGNKQNKLQTVLINMKMY